MIMITQYIVQVNKYKTIYRMILRFKKKIKLENQKILDCIDDEDKLYCKENTLLIHNYNI